MSTRLVLRDRLRRGMRDSAASVWSDDEINDAINFAVHSAWPDWFIVKQSSTITVAADTFIYALPSDCKHVLEVYLEQDSNLPYRGVHNWRHSRTTATTGTVTDYVYLDNSEDYDAGKIVKVIYQAEPPELSNDTDTTNVPDDFLMAKAKAYMLEMEMRDPGQDVDTVKALMQWNQQIAEDIRQRKGMAMPPQQVRYGTDSSSQDILNVPGLIDHYREG